MLQAGSRPRIRRRQLPKPRPSAKDSTSPECTRFRRTTRLHRFQSACPFHSTIGQDNADPVETSSDGVSSLYSSSHLAGAASRIDCAQRSARITTLNVKPFAFFGWNFGTASGATIFAKRLVLHSAGIVRRPMKVCLRVRQCRAWPVSVPV